MCGTQLSLPFEKLHLAFVLFGFLSRVKRAEVFTFFGPGINLTRIQTILA
jgi:hypothetical protein